jgi:hypothetical protein
VFVAARATAVRSDAFSACNRSSEFSTLFSRRSIIAKASAGAAGPVVGGSTRTRRRAIARSRSVTP